MRFVFVRMNDRTVIAKVMNNTKMEKADEKVSVGEEKFA